ncbi:hypothetical protein PLESTB_001062400 [Pleodorina starrii]|uniref:Hydroxyproline O-arabinosyltransferase-like domain-containing protein n=1 Tax=Pleodorina starrii TaxID=330485 RepID=A0A9W6BPJ9_9CHLO|nr:hypothetical protein PLESTM_001280300 [Pleodorina starrii]GLC56081.1 hypothetical protein PLESTB_001062400 [Pleodorina starrii]GLC64065.1 hypothetical protein PLESTF_000114500 [Pleodorina starrii]
MKPGARGQAAKRSSYNTFVTIICFSVGLLGGYLILGSPRTVNHVEAVKSDARFGSTGSFAHGTVRKVWGTRRELLTPKAASSSSIGGRASAAGLPLNVALGNKPPANGEVSVEMAAALKKQQSDTSERVAPAKGDVSQQMAAALKKQQSDNSESVTQASKAAETDKKEALMKAQQSETSEQKAVAGADSARAEQAKSAVAGGSAAAAAAASATTTTTTAATPAATTTAAIKPAATTTSTPAATAGAATGTGAAATATTTAAAGTTSSTTTTATSAAASASPPPPVSLPSPPPPQQQQQAGAVKGVFPDANTWPITPVKEKMPGNTIHTLFTSNGSPYQNIQARIMVGTYNIIRKMPGGERLVALTRILHRTTPDEVMDEIPTFIAQPLQPECDKWCWFPVADRANAMQQWINAAEKDPSLIKAPWLLLLETDYVWMKPLPDPGDAYDRSVPGWSFGFDYIAPSIPIIVQLLKERCPDCDPKTVPNSGPAPVLARFSDFKAATPIWEELSKWIETHEDAKKLLGWVREMYAWDIGVAANKLNIKNLGPPASPLISQPPHDRQLGNASMYHYTWGTIYKKPGVEKEIWMFDKRTYTAYEHQLKLPAIPMPPAWTDDITLQDGLKVTQELHDTVVSMLARMNEAIAQLPDLTDKVNKQKQKQQ